MTDDECRVLEALHERPVPATIGEIADATELAGPAANRVLRALEARTPRLVEGTDPDDEEVPLVDLGRGGIRVWRITTAGDDAFELECRGD